MSEQERGEYLNDDLENVRQQYMSEDAGGDPVRDLLEDLLEELGLMEYADAFDVELGVTECPDLAYLTLEDLQGIGIRGPKARRLLEVCKEYA